MSGSRRGQPGRHRSAFPRWFNYAHRPTQLVSPRQGYAEREGSDAMLLRRTIGISLACLMTSACAIATEPEENTAHDPGDATGVTPRNAEIPPDISRSFT